jgi:hypothetical protein
MDVIEIDIAIVGAGGAGLRAAIAVAEADSSLTVALISKVYPMRSHTVAAEGGAAGVIKDNDSLDNHFHDTVSGGDWLCDQDAVELFVNTAPLELLQLEHWGCPWSREANGKVAVRPFGGMKIERTWFAADKTGFHMLHALFQHSMRFDRIVRLPQRANRARSTVITRLTLPPMSEHCARNHVRGGSRPTRPRSSERRGAGPEPQVNKGRRQIKRTSWFLTHAPIVRSAAGVPWRGDSKRAGRPHSERD